MNDGETNGRMNQSIPQISRGQHNTILNFELLVATHDQSLQLHFAPLSIAIATKNRLPWKSLHRHKHKNRIDNGRRRNGGPGKQRVGRANDIAFGERAPMF